MLVRSIAPLRLGMAGGGTDVSPYSDLYGGAILNITISLNAYATIEPRTDGKIRFHAVDKKVSMDQDMNQDLGNEHNLKLLTGAYQYLKMKYDLKPLSFELSTYVDVEAGS